MQYKLATLFPLYFLELQLDALGYFIKSISLDKRRRQPTACYFWAIVIVSSSTSQSRKSDQLSSPPPSTNTFFSPIFSSLRNSSLRLTPWGTAALCPFFPSLITSTCAPISLNFVIFSSGA